VFRRDLYDFKITVDEYNQQKHSDGKSDTDMYTITFIDANGGESTKKFKRTSVGKRASLLMNDLTTSLEDMGQSVTVHEKRQVLIELLERLC
jgi:hypothetical protein